MANPAQLPIEPHSSSGCRTPYEFAEASKTGSYGKTWASPL